MLPSLIAQDDRPIEIAPGRGDLRKSSTQFSAYQPRSLALVDRVVSYANLFAEQQLVASTAGWLMRQAIRVPLKVYRRTDDDNRVRLRGGDHPLALAVEQPWDGGSTYSLVCSLLGPVLVHGNGLDQVDQGARNRIRFVPCDWRNVTPIQPWRDAIAGWEVDTDDPTVKRTVPADQMVHTAYWSPLGPLGVSPLQQLGVTLAVEDAAFRYQRAMFRNGARPPSAIEADEKFLELGREERKTLMDNLREDIDEIYAGPENAGRPALLPPGLKWNSVGHTAVEAQLIEQRVVSRTEAIAVYGLTPAAIGVVERSTELAEQRLMAYTDGLAPPLILCELAINAQVATRLLKEPDVFVEFDFAGILRPDKLKEIEALREAIGTALLTPNEGRKVINMPEVDIPAANTLYLPYNNLWPIAQPPPEDKQKRELQQTEGQQGESS